MQASMLYTMGMALDRAADNGATVSLLVESAWLEGQVAAVDTIGVVLESPDGHHAVVRVDRISAVKVHSESPYRPSIPGAPEEGAARPMPGTRVA